jgi:hypothetical protein
MSDNLIPVDRDLIKEKRLDPSVLHWDNNNIEFKGK